MDSQRVLLPRQNPNSLVFPPPPKPLPPSILDRFKALLRRRYDDDDAASDDEIVRIYEIVLSELTLNSKPIITDLTIIAGDHKEHAKGIADAICDRILEVPSEHKLPSLYLLDSIVKNIGGEYVRYFSSRLPDVFGEAYRQVQPNLHNAMRHLFGTWSTVFPTSVLRKIEAQLHFSQTVNNQNISSRINPPRVAEATQRTHGIHVNPKYLRQLENPTMDADGVEMLDSTGSMGHTNFGLGTNKMQQASIGRHGKQYPGEGQNQLQFSTNGHQRQSPRALIDAYGSDKRTETPSNKPLVEPLDIYGMENKTVSPSWQNTEEEEFNWEDMSPTLLEHSRSNGILPPIMLAKERSSGIVAAKAAALGQDARSGWNGGGSLDQMNGIQNHGRVSHFPHDVLKISHHLPNSSQHLASIGGRTRNAHVFPIDNIPITKINSYGLDIRPPTLHAPFRTRPSVNVHASRPPSLNPSLLKQDGNQFEAINSSNTILDLGPSKSSFIPEQLLDGGENNNIGTSTIPQIPNQPSGLVLSNQHNRGQALQPQIFPPPDVRGSFADSQAPAASHFSHGNSLQRHGPAISATVSMSLPIGQFPLPVQNMTNNTFPIPRGALPTFPAPRPPLQVMPHRNVSPYPSGQQPAGAFSGLINSLMAQGLISLTGQSTAQDSVGIEFNPDILKIRHESAINALYTDLPRQCTTCGLRFKSQEEHSSHMDWHVTKNRMSKNRKQKPSRKWFVSEKMWLSGAEALGTEAVPGFLPTETIEETKEDEEMAVPADEDQNTCALCGEPFEEFYSDETEEWMYRGAAYLNVSKGTVAGMDRSQLGPIVHAKCRSESSVVPVEEFRQDDEGDGEGSQRKRMRR